MNAGRKRKRICPNSMILPEIGMSWRIHDVEWKIDYRAKRAEELKNRNLPRSKPEARLLQERRKGLRYFHPTVAK